MSAIVRKKSKSNRAGTSSTNSSQDGDILSRIPPSVVGIICGAILGLSAPGIGVWLVAWFALAPLFLLISSSRNLWVAIWRGFLYGFAYTLVYASWLLGLQPLDWLGFNGWQGLLLASAAWFEQAGHQATTFAFFALCMKLLPMHGGFLPEKKKGRWKLPALLVIPVLWLLCINKIGNAHYFLGCPWTMLEYSQYKQLPIIQICSIIGGIGLNCLMVSVNAAVAAFLGTYFFKKMDLSVSATKKPVAIGQLLVCTLAVTCVSLYGAWQIATRKYEAPVQASVLQGNINIDMQKTMRRYTLADLTHIYDDLLEKTPSGLTIWTESSMPCYLKQEPSLVDHWSTVAQLKHLDMVLGAMDQDVHHKPFNSAYGMTASGKLLESVYHKRYLVAFGEYTPAPAQHLPEWILRLTNTPAGGGFESGTDPVVLQLNSGAVGPLICYETLSPELVASTVRKGAQLLVNVSDLAWFHNSICGEQMVAFSVLRAVESNRFFIFAANTGPSAIIDPTGRITRESASGKATVLAGKVGFLSHVTPFSQWFVF